MFRGIVVARVLDDAFAHYEREIQAAKSGIALLEIFHNAQGVQVVIEKQTVGAHGGIQRLFARVAEWRMAEIMHERERFGEIHVECKRSRDGARDLRYFDGVSEPVAKVVRITARENLRLIFESAKGAGMDDAVTIALKVVAVGVRRFREAASAGMFHMDRVAGQHG